MSQPVPIVTPEDVVRVVQRDFPSVEVAGVLNALEAYGTKAGHMEVVRVRLAILRLANGDLGKLQAALRNAYEDHREVIACAEYPVYFSTISPTEKDAIKKTAAIAEDWDNYRRWLDK